MLGQVRDRREPWDLVVLGGGATGVGVALDAAARGYSVALLEAHDFGKGTSSRSTKLVHGGVRYLAQGNLPLVRESLRERGLLLKNAPHVVHSLGFLVPSYNWWGKPFYGIGLTLYHWLSGRRGLGRPRFLSRKDALGCLPTLRQQGLRGGVLYRDGQFDDTRLLINLAMTATEKGAVLLNYAPAIGFERDGAGGVVGAIARDEESGEELRLDAKVVINATGAYCDDVRALADPGEPRMVAPSQGIHLVLDRSFLPGESALLVPKTPDGRVLFAIPWHGHTLVGTTDVAIDGTPLEPRPTEAEIDFVLETANRFLERPATRADVLSTFAGIRPLVKAGAGKSTAALSRDHTVHVDPSGLLTITGGKWTTYRSMAEDCVDRAEKLAGWQHRPCPTLNLPIHGADADAARHGDLAIYGSDAPGILALAAEDPELAGRLHPDLPYLKAEVVWAARREMARTVEDVLARRLRALFLNAKATREMAPAVAELLARELGQSEEWQSRQVAEFDALARGYSIDPEGSAKNSQGADVQDAAR